MTPEWAVGFTFGITKVYLLFATSFSIWTPSLLVSSFPFISLYKQLKWINKIEFSLKKLKDFYQLTVGLGLASTMHSNLTLSSLLIGPNGSGTLTKTGPPKIIHFYFIKKKLN